MTALDHAGNLVAPDGRVYFYRVELACPRSDLLIFAPGFGLALRELRHDFGETIVVRAGGCCRSYHYNEAEGGHETSLHVCDTPFHDAGGTAALDIESLDIRYRWRLARLALARGWSVGCFSWGLHLDRRDYAGLAPGFFPGGA